jgi:hypothetical protein
MTIPQTVRPPSRRPRSRARLPPTTQETVSFSAPGVHIVRTTLTLDDENRIGDGRGPPCSGDGSRHWIEMSRVRLGWLRTTISSHRFPKCSGGNGRCRPRAYRWFNRDWRELFITFQLTGKSSTASLQWSNGLFKSKEITWVHLRLHSSETWHVAAEISLLPIIEPPISIIGVLRSSAPGS